MAGSQISTSVTIINSLLGFQAISLSGIDTTSAPSIMAGSKVEIASAFFTWDSNEAPNASSWTAITTANTAYITLTPAGTAGTQTVSAAYTETAPVWSTSKQGWYASAASNVRIIGGMIKTDPTTYNTKWLYDSIQRKTTVQDRYYEMGEWNMQGTATIVITTNPFGNELDQIVGMDAMVFKDDGSPNKSWDGFSSLQIGAANIAISRKASGDYDNTDYNGTASTVLNRGYVTIHFKG